MKNKQDWIRFLIGLFVSILAFAIVLYFVDLGTVVEELRSANIPLASSVFLFTVLWVLVRSAVWRSLLQEKATFGQVFLTVNEGYLINNVLPFRLGELARSFLLSRKANLGFWQVFSTILIERALDLMIAAGFLLASLPFVVNASWALQAAIGVGVLVVLGLSTLYLLARNQEWVTGRFQALFQRWPKMNKYGSRQISAFLAGLTVLTDGRRFILSVLWMTLNWSVATLQFYFLLLAFSPDAKLLWAAYCLGVVAIGMAAPSSPGAVGVMEASYVAALNFFGVDPSTSFAVALVARVANLLITGVLGVYGLTVDGVSLLGVFRQVREITPDQSTGLDKLIE